jgi:gliding motility-associated-like protein
MKKNVLIIFFCLFACFSGHSQGTKSNLGKGGWKVNPFDHTIFIENKGQFENHVPTSGKILFEAILGNSRAYFTPQGIIYRYDELRRKNNTKNTDPEHPAIEDKTDYVQMQWIGSNPDVKVEGLCKRTDYYVYAVKNGPPVHAGLYKQIIYRNLYPGIDVKYIFPNKGGLKYSLIVHPGADLSKVRVKYKDSYLSLTNDGDLLVKSKSQNITEHRPLTFYSNDSSIINVSFKINNNEAYFSSGDLNSAKGFVVDPWVTNPNFTSNSGFDNSVYDLDFDNNNNVYGYGGGGNFQLVKVNSAGTILWTYTADTISYTNNYGDFAIDKRTGTCYLAQGFNPDHGCNVLKLNTLGDPVDTFHGDPNLDEMWRAIYNPCNDNIVIGAGGTQGHNQACVVDTTMTTLTPVNILSTMDNYHDICLITMDPDGSSCYMATAQSGSFPTQFNNVLIKLPVPALAPVTYMISDGFDFQEVNSIYYVHPPFNGGALANAMNGMAASYDWLYMYNGKKLRKCNKTTGLATDSITISSSAPYQWGGLDIDPCDNVYAGYKDSIKIYNSSLSLTTQVSLPDTVYDLAVGNNNLLFACGRHFIACITNPINQQLISSATGVPSSCSASDGQASVTVNCGNPPYTFTWSNGETGAKDTLLSEGIYTVTVTDASCPPRVDTAVITVSSKAGYSASLIDSVPTCARKGNITVFASGGAVPYTYAWSNGQTNQQDTGLAAGTYSCEVTDNAGCKYDAQTTIIMDSNLPINVVPPSDTLCLGASISISASGATSYSWLPATGLNCANCPNPVATPTTTTTYTVTGTDFAGCYGSASIAILVSSIPHVTASSPSDTICTGNAITLSAVGASHYTWMPATALSCVNCASPVANPTVTVTYSVTGTNTYGCSDSNKITLNVKPRLIATISAVPSNDTICNGDSIHLTGNGATHYLWTPGNSISNNIWVKPNANITYSLSASSNSCSADTTINIVVNPSPTVTITPSDTICIGDSINLIATGGGNYLWSNNSTTSSVRVGPTTLTAYSVKVTNSYNCAVSASTKIYVDVPTFTVCCNDTIISGDTVRLQTTGTGVYAWLPSGGLSCNTCPDPIASPSITTTYTVQNTDASNCSTQRILIIDVQEQCSDFKIPNVFTPNNDGNDDYLVINVLNPSAYSITIYDRWGKEVFNSTNVTSYWNGKINGTGALVPDGVYYYVVKASCGSKEYDKKGFIEVVGEK